MPSRDASRALLPVSAPQAIATAVDAFATAAESDSRVVASFIGGSYADGTWDAHSDLDLYVIVEDDEYESFFHDRRHLLESMGQLVLAEDFGGFGFDLIVFMLANGVEGELGLGRRSGFTHIHGGAIRTLFDRYDILAGVEFDLSRPDRAQRARSIQRTVAWFWRQMSLFATAATRGLPWTSYGYLQQARSEALDLVWWMDAPDAWPGGFEKLERLPGTTRASPLQAAFPGLDLEEQLDASEVLAGFVAREGRNAHEGLDTPYPDRLEETVRTKLGSVRTR